MTREEAIEILQNTMFIAPSEVNVDKAIDMAIEALKAEPSTDNINCVKCKYYTETEDADGVHGNCTHDTISRADAIEAVRCKDCRHADECHKSVQYTRNEPNTVTIGYSPIEWCSRGERKGGEDE